MNEKKPRVLALGFLLSWRRAKKQSTMELIFNHN